MAISFKFDTWRNWLRVASAKNSATVLSSRHIYILPTRFGFVFAFLLLAMLLGAINYSLSLGFVLTFLLAGMGNMAMLHTWRNIAHLQILGSQASPVFAGEQAIFNVHVSDNKSRARYAIGAHFQGVAPVFYDIPALGEHHFRLMLPTQKRGLLQAPRVTLFTEFPLNLFFAWAYAELNMQSLVYPHPALSQLPMPQALDDYQSGKSALTAGDDDFTGHKHYQQGDSPRRIDWKASSREQGLLTKQFQGEAQSTICLDWSLTPLKDSEKRISQLTRWVVDAHQQQLKYGLKLPHLEIAASSGESHFKCCLEALALMEV